MEDIAHADAADFRMAVVHKLHALVGRVAVGNERRDQGAGAGADIDIEIVDCQVHQHIVDGTQSTELIDDPHDPAASQNQSNLTVPVFRSSAL